MKKIIMLVLIAIFSYLLYQDHYGSKETPVMKDEIEDVMEKPRKTRAKVTTNKPNTKPISIGESYSVYKGESVVIELKGKDREGTPLLYEVKKYPLKGKLIGNAPNLTYQADNKFVGKVSFEFSSFDGELESDPQKINIVVHDKNESNLEAKRQELYKKRIDRYKNKKVDKERAARLKERREKLLRERIKRKQESLVNKKQEYYDRFQKHESDGSKPNDITNEDDYNNENFDSSSNDSYKNENYNDNNDNYEDSYHENTESENRDDYEEKYNSTNNNEDIESNQYENDSSDNSDGVERDFNEEENQINVFKDIQRFKEANIQDEVEIETFIDESISKFKEESSRMNDEDFRENSNRFMEEMNRVAPEEYRKELKEYMEKELYGN